MAKFEGQYLCNSTINTEKYPCQEIKDIINLTYIDFVKKIKIACTPIVSLQFYKIHDLRILTDLEPKSELLRLLVYRVSQRNETRINNYVFASLKLKSRHYFE